MILKDNPFSKCRFSQVGFVVRDLDDTMEKMRRVFEMEPAQVSEGEIPGRKYRGEPGKFAARIAFYYFGDVQFEFIQPVNEEGSIWKEFFDQGGEGLHHVRFAVDSFSQAEKHMKEKGIDVSMEGLSVVTEGARWACFDSEEQLGFIAEIFGVG